MLQAPFGWEEIKKFYGWEERYLKDLHLWEARMVVVKPPAGRKFFYAGKETRGIRFNPALAQEASELFQEISDVGRWEFIEKTGGGFAWRTQRGSFVKLSMHALGGAFDSDPEANPLGRPFELTALGSEPGLEVIRIARRRGWKSGGDWERPDGMHLQVANGF